MNAMLSADLPIKAHRAPDPAPIEEPSSEPFDKPYPHHHPGLPQDEDPVPDPNPSMDTVLSSCG